MMGLGKIAGETIGGIGGFFTKLGGGIVDFAANMTNGFIKTASGGDSSLITDPINQAITHTTAIVSNTVNNGLIRAGGTIGDATTQGLADLMRFPSPTTPATTTILNNRGSETELS